MNRSQLGPIGHVAIRRKGQIAFGLIPSLIVSTVVLMILGLIEVRGIRDQAQLRDVAGSVQPARLDTIEPGNEGQLVHLAGAISTDVVLEDDVLGVRVQGLQLLRQVEIYDEFEDDEGEWQSSWSIVQPNSGYPATPAGFNLSLVGTTGWQAKDWFLGAYQLSKHLDARLGPDQRLLLSDQSLRHEGSPGTVLSDGTTYFVGIDPNSPQPGDVRIEYRFIPFRRIAVVGQQRGNRIEPLATSDGRSVGWIRAGESDVAAMFARLESELNVNTTAGRIAMGIALLFAMTWVCSSIEKSRLKSNWLLRVAADRPWPTSFVAMAISCTFVCLVVGPSFRSFGIVAIAAVGTLLITTPIMLYQQIVATRPDNAAEQFWSDESDVAIY